MKIKKINKRIELRFLATIPFLMGLIIFVYWDSTKAFYQQDEWSTLGLIYAYGRDFLFINTKSIFNLLLGQGRVFSNLFSYLLIGKFPFDITYISLFGIVLHAVNTVLVFFLARKIIKNGVSSLLASLFFGLNSVCFQAVVWSAAIINTLPATTFIILSVFCYLDYLDRNKRNSLLLTFLFLYLSLHFKETGLYLFLLFPAISLLFKRYSLKKFVRNYWAFIIFGLLTISSWLIQFKLVPTEKDLFLTGSSPNFLITLVTRSILYPLTSFSLVFIPQGVALDFVKRITSFYYPSIPSEVFNLVAQTAVLDSIAIFASLFLLLVILFLFKDEKKSRRSSMIFLLAFTALSYLPYVGIAKSYSYLESRYYYLASVGAGILLGFLLSKFLSRPKKSYIKFLILFPFVIYIFFHAGFVRKDLSELVANGEVRKVLLEGIFSIKPKLSEGKSVFYVTGDRNFYVSEGNRLPLQQGTGYTLMVWYYSKNPQLKPLIKEGFLWDLGSQGYKEVDGFGFGYFWDKDKLEDVIQKERIKPAEVTALYYDSKARKLTKDDWF